VSDTRSCQEVIVTMLKHQPPMPALPASAATDLGMSDLVEVVMVPAKPATDFEQ
jgi:hypothetical protein